MKDDKSIFAESLADVFIPEILGEPDLISVEHEFSNKFERKMSRTIKMQKKPFNKIVNIVGRSAAVLAAAFILITGTNVMTDASGEAAVNYIVLNHYNNDEIIVNYNKNYSFPETIEQEYTIDPPEGFVLTSENYYEFSIDKEYRNGDDFIMFHQLIIPCGAVFSIDNEHGVNELFTDDDGTEYILHVEEECCIILWSNGIYLFEIFGNVDKNCIIDLYKSTKIK